MTKSKVIEYVLYGFTVIFCFIQASGYYAGDILWYIQARSVFYAAEVLLLVIVIIRCSNPLSKSDDDYFKTTGKVYHAAEVCFVMIAIVTVISVASLIPIFLFLPSYIFEYSYANGLFVLLLMTGATLGFYIFTGSIYDKVKKYRGEKRYPLSEKTEDFYAFIHSADEKEQPDREEMPASLLDEIVPGEEDFQRHLQQISALNTASEQKELWECPYCGSQNPADGEQCNFCGAAMKGRYQ